MYRHLSTWSLKSTVTYCAELWSLHTCTWKQTKILCGQLNCSVKLADSLTRCSSRPQGKSEARCEMLVLYRRGYCNCVPMAHAVRCRGRSAGTISASVVAPAPQLPFLLLSLLLLLWKYDRFTHLLTATMWLVRNKTSKFNWAMWKVHKMLTVGTGFFSTPRN